jgi:hypothetical protein
MWRSDAISNSQPRDLHAKMLGIVQHLGRSIQNVFINASYFLSPTEDSMELTPHRRFFFFFCDVARETQDLSSTFGILRLSIASFN